MPNHVHALFAMLDATPLNELIKSWKTFSSKRLKSLLGDNWSGRQKDYHDRLVRNENHFASCLRYIHENPQKARLSPKEYVLFESSLN